ncbi:HupE/UreJ family protein [Daejeonella sp.]|uniref:HupE/UreJ family protein n=1 Tax=Daejeonella sp. TaxID=2805397 RepID=UPI0025C54EDA|nr:HupE/UreJ family protein [Daejeonella sp.]
MNQFELYFGLGVSHILDIEGYDHILFVISLCTIYTFVDWRKILVLVTAFTIGHSLTLALATLKFISVNASFIEFLIPVTIAITSASNLLNTQPKNEKAISLNYFFALFFGLIHGLGFSNFLKSLLGKESSILEPLLAFNLGLELGQIVIVIAFLALTFVLINVLKVRQKLWIQIVSIIVFLVSIYLIYEAKFW